MEHGKNLSKIAIWVLFFFFSSFTEVTFDDDDNKWLCSLFSLSQCSLNLIIASTSLNKTGGVYLIIKRLEIQELLLLYKRFFGGEPLVYRKF